MYSTSQANKNQVFIYFYTVESLCKESTDGGKRITSKHLFMDMC